MFENLLSLRGKPNNSQQRWILALVGGGILFVTWLAVSESGLNLVPKSILPSPLRVIGSYKQMQQENQFLANMEYSIFLNILGYVEAIAIALPLGFLVGLFPLTRYAFLPYVTALRYLPLPAMAGMFIYQFGLEANMKIQFLAVSIIVYLMVSVVMRIDALNDTYLDTVKTCGASKWQQIRYVFIPDVLSKVWDDIITLLPISWTYITIAEAINKSDGGLGAMATTLGRVGRTDMVYAILLSVLVIGIIQDQIARVFGRLMFPWRFKGAT